MSVSILSPVPKSPKSPQVSLDALEEEIKKWTEDDLAQTEKELKEEKKSDEEQKTLDQLIEEFIHQSNSKKRGLDAEETTIITDNKKIRAAEHPPSRPSTPNPILTTNDNNKDGFVTCEVCGWHCKSVEKSTCNHCFLVKDVENIISFL